MLAYETTVTGKVASIIYSGDTIVDPSAWGSSGTFAALDRSRSTNPIPLSQGKILLAFDRVRLSDLSISPTILARILSPI